MVSSWMEKLAGKGRRGGNGVLVQIAREVVGQRRSLQGAISEVRHPAVLDALSDDDFKILDNLIDERLLSDANFAATLARLTHAAAHAKGFDRQTVDAALRLDGLLPSDDPSREREKLLRDAYRAAQRSGYVQGGRRSLARLGRRAVSAGESERARQLLQQQVDLGPESIDTEDEVDSSILLGDILRRDGDLQGALALFGRAANSARRLGFERGVAEAIIRQIELSRSDLDLDTLASLQEEALDAASKSRDWAIGSRVVVNYADTLVKLGRLDDAVTTLEDGLALARKVGDLNLENHCLTLLTDVERELGHLQDVADRERDLVAVEERQGNQPAAAQDAVQHGSTLMSLGRVDQAREAFARAVELAREAGDVTLEQRAYGGVGIAYSQLNQPVEALNHLMLALDLARASGDAAHEAQWLGSIGEALWKFDQPEDAVQAINQAIGAARRAEDTDLQAGMMSLMGQIHVSLRERGKARNFYTQALALYREHGHIEEEIATLSSLGALAMEMDAPSESIGLYEKALQLAAAHDQRAAAVRIYGRLARLSQRQGDQDAALEALAQAVNLAETVNQPALLSQALQHLAVAQDAAGDPAAMDTYENALVASRKLGDRHGETMMLVNVGARLIATGSRRDGVELLRHAIGLAGQLGPDGERLKARAESLIGEPAPARRRESTQVTRHRERPVGPVRDAAVIQRRPEPELRIPPASSISPLSDDMLAQSTSLPR
ncbi:MAG: tetratricopeptide repeat protein [Chloroflexia bacterium]|nr:tetratricopeptide repeat protein [Chloroflexia bacterium]